MPVLLGEHVEGLLVFAVQLGVGAVLLHHKDVHPQPQDFIQLFQRQFLKAFPFPFHGLSLLFLVLKSIAQTPGKVCRPVVVGPGRGISLQDSFFLLHLSNLGSENF